MDHYETFYQLHHQPNPFLLANAWNAKSARLIEAAGFPAIATSSGAIADVLGYGNANLAVLVYRAAYRHLDQTLKEINTSQSLTPLF